METPIDLFTLAHNAFEDLIADLLARQGFAEVISQSKTTPVFDIIALERTSSAVRSSFTVRWGVQCKRQRVNVGPAILDSLPTEARERDISAILLVSASDFTPRTISLGENMEKRESHIHSVRFWSGRDIRQHLVRQPSLLTKYFNIDLSKVLPKNSREFGPSDAHRLTEFLAHVCGVPVLGPFDLVDDSDLDRIDRQYAASLVSGDLHSFTQKVLDRYALPSTYSTQELSTRHIPLGAYDRYDSLEHFTTIEGRGELLYDSNALSVYQLTDCVTYRTTLQSPAPFIFRFVTRSSDWDSSHFDDRNEYTWRMADVFDDLSPLAHHLQVHDMSVGSLSLSAQDRNISPESLRIAITHPRLAALRGRSVQVRYRVTSLFLASHKSLLSSLHAPADNYRFRLRCADGFQTQPRVHRLLGGRANRGTVKTTPVEVQVDSKGPVPRGSGIVIAW